MRLSCRSESVLCFSAVIGYGHMTEVFKILTNKCGATLLSLTLYAYN